MIAILLAAISILSILLLLKVSKNSPPGPWGIPLLGYYPFLTKDPFAKLQQLSSKYGDIMQINIFNENYIFLNSIELVKECFINQGDNFLNRPDQFSFWYVNYDNNNVTTLNGAAWKANRKFIVSKLSLLGMGKSEFESKIHEACDVLLSNVGKHKQDAFDVHPYLSNYSSNVINQLLFSIIYKPDDPAYIKLSNINVSYQNATEKFDSFLYGNMFRLFTIFVERDKYHLMRKLKNEFHKYFMEMIDERIKQSNQTNECRDLLDWYLKEIKQGTEHFDLEKLIHNLTTIFFAGADTTSMTLYFALNLMASNQEIQRRVRNEILEVIGKTTQVSLIDLKSLIFTRAVIAEVQRFVCLVPFGLVHSNETEAFVGGYEIPKRSIIIANLWRLSRDKRFFPNPEQFDPNNFLNENGQFVKKEASIPFSIGKRNCFGAKLAEAELFIAFVRLMQTFEFDPPSGEKIKFVVTEGLIRCLNRCKLHAIAY